MSKDNNKKIEDVKKTQFYVTRNDAGEIVKVFFPNEVKVGLTDSQFRSKMEITGDLVVTGSVTTLGGVVGSVGGSNEITNLTLVNNIIKSSVGETAITTSKTDVITGGGIKVGNNVKNFLVGDKVGALVNGGGYAEFCKADKSSVFHVPKNISFNEAACIPECFFTAWSNIVMRGKLKKKQKILIHGGTSGVGIASIQIAKLFNSYIVTTVGNKEKVSFCKKLGVDQTINYNESNFFEEIKNSKISSVDLILDFIGGDYINKNINLLNNDGKLINIGFQNGSKAEINLMKIMLKRLTITGSTLRIRNNSFKGKILNNLIKFVFPQIEKGKIKIFIDSIYKLDDVVKAHKRLDEGKHIGKIVLNI